MKGIGSSLILAGTRSDRGCPTACGTLAADWRPGSQGVGDAGRAPQLPAVGPNEE
jgi:hypothetical protein